MRHDPNQQRNSRGIDSHTSAQKAAGPFPDQPADMKQSDVVMTKEERDARAYGLGDSEIEQVRAQVPGLKVSFFTEMECTKPSNTGLSNFTKDPTDILGDVVRAQEFCDRAFVLRFHGDLVIIKPGDCSLVILSKLSDSPGYTISRLAEIGVQETLLEDLRSQFPDLRVEVLKRRVVREKSPDALEWDFPTTAQYALERQSSAGKPVVFRFGRNMYVATEGEDLGSLCAKHRDNEESRRRENEERMASLAAERENDRIKNQEYIDKMEEKYHSLPACLQAEVEEQIVAHYDRETKVHRDHHKAWHTDSVDSALQIARELKTEEAIKKVFFEERERPAEYKDVDHRDANDAIVYLRKYGNKILSSQGS